MKKTLTIKVEYLDIKGKVINKTEENELRLELFKKAVKEFKKELKDLLDSKQIKIIREDFPRPEIVVEFSNKETIYPRLLKADIVEIIDSSVYNKE